MTYRTMGRIHSVRRWEASLTFLEAKGVKTIDKRGPEINTVPLKWSQVCAHSLECDPRVPTLHRFLPITTDPEGQLLRLTHGKLHLHQAKQTLS